jgi:hypothetical protein
LSKKLTKNIISERIEYKMPKKDVVLIRIPDKVRKVRKVKEKKEKPKMVIEVVPVELCFD